MVSRSDDFGISIGDISIDFTAVMERVNKIRNTNSSSMKNWLDDICDFYPGTGKFINDHVVAIGKNYISGKKIYIHIGTRSRDPDIPGSDEVPWLNNESLLNLSELPEHLIVICGSYIGL